MRKGDIEDVSSLTAQSFGFGNFPGVEDEAIIKLEEWYAASIRRQASEKLTEFMTRRKNPRPYRESTTFGGKFNP